MNTQYYKLLTGKNVNLEALVNQNLKAGFCLHGNTFITGFSIGEGYGRTPEFAQAVVFTGTEEEVKKASK